MTSLRHRFARSPSAAQRRPRRRTAKGRENKSAKEGEKRETVLLFFLIDPVKRVDREKISTRDWQYVILGL
jgi:hypothetical protein